jgi:hypothetical protein
MTEREQAIRAAVEQALDSNAPPEQLSVALTTADALLLLTELDSARKALTRLVQRYVRDQGKHSQYIAMVTIEGSSSPEWNEALKALGLRLGPVRTSSYAYSRGRPR